MDYALFVYITEHKTNNYNETKPTKKEDRLSVTEYTKTNNASTVTQSIEPEKHHTEAPTPSKGI